MKILSIHVLKKEDEKAVFLYSNFSLGFINFLKRSFAKEPLKFAARTSANKIKKGDSARIETPEFEGAIVYINSLENDLCYIIITDSEYPKTAAVKVLTEIRHQFELIFDINNLKNIKIDKEHIFPAGQEIIDKYQDPQEADKLIKLENKLKEIESMLSKTMNDLLERSENLDELMSQSEDISNTAFQFYQNSKKANQKCCSLY